MTCLRMGPFSLVLIAALLVLPGCKRHKTTEPAPVVTVVENHLVFQRSDSTVVEMGTEPLVCCGLYDPGFVNERAMRIVLYDPANQKAGWQILILIDRALQGATTTLPTVVIPPSHVPYVSMFVSNEQSSDADDSSGTIVVHSFSCTTTAMSLDFIVDAVLGS